MSLGDFGSELDGLEEMGFGGGEVALSRGGVTGVKGGVGQFQVVLLFRRGLRAGGWDKDGQREGHGDRQPESPKLAVFMGHCDRGRSSPLHTRQYLFYIRHGGGLLLAVCFREIHRIFRFSARRSGVLFGTAFG